MVGDLNLVSSEGVWNLRECYRSCEVPRELKGETPTRIECYLHNSLCYFHLQSVDVAAAVCSCLQFAAVGSHIFQESLYGKSSN
jgi:hypothetical protein